MNTSQLIIGGLEIIGLVMMVRIWQKRRHKNAAVRLIWSVILLVPLFGILAYVFLNENPDRNLRTRTYRDSTGGEAANYVDFGNHPPPHH
jgi:hypothetical protein